MRLFPATALTVFLVLLFQPPLLRADDLRISAAASLADALKEINAAFEKQTGTTVKLNLGASSLLARQISEGAPADIFFSADEARMDALEKQGLLAPGTRESQLSNTLVIVVPAGSPVTLTSLRDLTGPAFKKIATGDTRAVPVGVYAREHLQKEGLWSAVEPKIVAMENVRAALAAVESGNASAGIVYRTDAGISRKVRTVLEIPAATGPRISYPMAVLKAAANPEKARVWLEFADQPAAHGIFRKYGFGVLPEPGTSGRETAPQ